MFDGIPSSIDHIRAGKLRPLAVTAATRLEVLPGIRLPKASPERMCGFLSASWLTHCR
jgi:hypothetical protein